MPALLPGRCSWDEHLNYTQAESPQNPKEEWTTGNPDARFPSLTRGGVTNDTPKVETVKNQFFQDHNTCQCRNLKIISFKTSTPSQTVSVSPGGVQALIPRQAAELVTPLICKGSLVLGLPAGDSSSGFWGHLSFIPEVQAVDSLLSRPPHPPKVETVKKSVLSRLPCLCKVGTVKNQLFQDYHILPVGSFWHAIMLNSDIWLKQLDKPDYA